MKIANFLFLKIIALVVTSVALVSPTKSSCQFPKTWSGKWFQLGQPRAIEINQTHINFKGICIETDSAQDRFLVEDRSDKENCYRCMVIHEVHRNVLQYKESTNCEPTKTTLDTLCEDITGDAPLFSMFRLDAKPEPCPFKGGPPFTFTYDRGHGECKSPVSKSDACTDNSRMLLRYQACPDVYGSESTVEELTCLAWWRAGSMRYMVGKLEHKMTSIDEDRYRCFVWSMAENGYSVAQSGDASCNGLQSATEGSRTMRLTKVDQTYHQNGGASCKFPSWLTAHRFWHLLDHSKTYHFSSHNGTLSVTSVRDGPNVLEMRAVCNSILETTDYHAMITAHITIGCESGYRCMSFYKRDGHVIEIQQSNKEVQISEDACNVQNFNSQTLPFTTLIADSLQRRNCPFLGRYTISNNNDLWKMAASTNQRATYAEDKPPCENGNQILSLGCNRADTMEFVSECSSDITAAYSCHGNWVDSNGTSYLIALPLNHMSVSSDRYCFVIYNTPDAASSTSSGSAVRPRRARHLQLYSLTKSCRRDLLANDGGEQHWMFNITHHADCDGSISGTFSSMKNRIGWLLSMQVVLFAYGVTRHVR